MPIMSVERLKSFDVMDKNGEKVGSVKDLLVDPIAKRINYVLLGSTGGVLPTLGLADKLFAVPIFAFRMDDNKLVMLHDKDKLKDAPSFSSYSPPDFNRDYESKLAEFWGTPRYWEIPLYHLEDTTAQDIMVKDVPTIHADTPIAEVSRIMTERGVDELPVIDEQGRVMGYATAQEMSRIFSPSRGTRPSTTEQERTSAPNPTVTEEGRAPAMPEKQERPPAPGL